MKIRAVLSDLNYKELISTFSMPAGAVVGLLGLSNANKAAIKVINTFEKSVISKLQRFLSEKKIFLTVDGIDAKDGGLGNVMLDITVSNIDVMSVIRVLLPMLDKSMENDAKLSKLGVFISKREELVYKSIEVLISGLSCSEREELVRDIVNALDENIIELLEGAARDNGMGFKINRLYAE